LMRNPTLGGLMGVAYGGGADSVITMTTARRHESERVLGVDACRVGWVGVVLSHGVTHTYVAASIADLADRALLDGSVDVVAVDMPIGLPDRGRRRADILVRAAVGPRRSSVFMTPVRAAMEASDHASAVVLNPGTRRRGSLRSGLLVEAQIAPGTAVGSGNVAAGGGGASRGVFRAACRRGAQRPQVDLGGSRTAPVSAGRRRRCARWRTG